MTESDPDIFDSPLKVKVKPFCKPDVHLKKSRQRIFSEKSIDLIYSFGYQSSFSQNLCMLEENIFIIVAGNHLNFLNIDTLTEDFIPSVNGASFTCVAVHPSTIFFAAAEKGRDFCISVFSYPALEVCKTLKDDSTIMPTRMMKFHPEGDLLIAVSFEPESKVNIWHWESQTVFFVSIDSSLFIHSINFSSFKEDIFVTSGEGHVKFWKIHAFRNTRDVITAVSVFEREEKSQESPKLIVMCTVSVSNTYLSATTEGYLLLWHPESLQLSRVTKILLLGDKPCHEGSICHIIIYKKYIITFGSDGYIKMWDYDEIFETLMSSEDKKEEKEDSKIIAVTEIDEKTGAEKVIAIQTSPVMEYLVSDTSDLVYGLINRVTLDEISFVIQDKNGVLFQVIIASDLSIMSVRKLLSGLGCNIIGLVSCSFYPFVAGASSLGNIAVYDCVDRTIFKFGTFSASITCIIWPSAKLDLFETSFLVGFCDGTIRWIAFSEDLDDFVLKFVIKPHIAAIEFMKMNESCTVLISQGSDSKLFIYSVGRYSLTPLGYYINHHEVADFTFLKYFTSLSQEEYSETLLILCKYSYIIECGIPDSAMFKDCMELRKTYFIECGEYQVYKINGLRQYHELGDRIYDSDCEEIPDLTEAGKAGLCKLKYDEKKERRESHRHELGFCGPVTPPEILSYLPSAISNHIWLSLGKEDFGYIFEFEFLGKFSKEPIDLVPIRALELLTAEIIPVLSMKYSPCGKFIFMGLEDGSMNLCYLDKAFMPSSGYDFAKFQLHDPEFGAVKHIEISPEGSFIITAGCDGNILLLKFSMFEYLELDDYGEKPVLTDLVEVEDIHTKKLSLEEEIKHKMNEKYHKMKERRISCLERLKDDYLVLKKDYSEYLNLCKSSLKKIKDIPEDLKINIEGLSCSQIALEMFTKSTNKLKKNIDVQYQKDLIKATLEYEKYFKFFKEKIEQELYTIKNDEENIHLSNFRTCVLPPIIQDIQLSSYPYMYKPKEKDSLHEQRRTGKVSNERVKLENQLTATRKAIIEYPSDTAVSEFISRYNKRKEAQIERLKEHIAEYEVFESIVIDDKKYKETLEEIKSSQFQFKENADVDHLSSEYCYSFAEKKAKTLIYFKTIHKFWNNFNSLLYTALNYNKHTLEMTATHPSIKENNFKDSFQVINSHIYHKMGKNFEVFKDSIKIEWNESLDNMLVQRNITKNDVSEQKKGKLQFQERFHHYFLSILMAMKPNVSCEKKFNDTRFILKCIELNSFKLDLMKEKKWLKIINELENLLLEENLELSSLQEKIFVLRDKRQVQKDKWMDLYNEFHKVIGLQNKHKGYFKEVFKKKIRPEDEKGSSKRHSSSESSESEQNIKSEDDIHDTDPRDVDENMLREVMHFRLKRQEIENKMKEYKRRILSHRTKELALQKKIQKTKDALEESWRILSTIPVNRKLEIENTTWPAILYPENVHKSFFEIKTNITQKDKVVIYEKMSQINEIVLKELKPIDKLIRNALIKLTDKVVNAEIMDLVDIASIFYPLIDNIAKDIDEYFMRIISPDSSEALEKVITPEKKPVNIIQEILSAAASKESKLKNDFEIKSNSMQDISLMKKDVSFKEDIIKETSFKEDISKKNIIYEIINTDYSNYSASDISESKISVKINSDICLNNEKHILKSNKEIFDHHKDVSSTKTYFKDININHFVLDAAPTLDKSLFVDYKYSSEIDYYMKPLSFEKVEEFKGKLAEQPDLSYTDYAKILFEFNISDVLEDLIKKVIEEEQSTKAKKLVSNAIYPIYPGGGLFLTKDILVEMEKEDPNNFPYTNFYQEIVGIEEKIEIPEQVHVEPHFKEMVIKYDLSSVPTDDFILLSIRKVVRALKAYNQIKISTLECEELLRLVDKQLSKAKNNRVNVEQELVAISRERNEEMTKKFSRIMDLEHLQDIIENPHLRIRKYESEKKLDSLKKELKKLKAKEINALKSLDALEYEDTLACHELLQLRQEYKFLNEKHSSNLRNFSQRSKKK